MKRSLRASLLSAAILPFFAGLALSQQQLNELQLCNGGDGLFIYSDPTPGVAGNPNPATDDYLWKNFPGAALRVPDANGPHQAEMNGFTFNHYDTDWSTDGMIYDRVFVRGMASATPDVVEPDFNDPNGALLQLGSWLTVFGAGAGNPCLLPGDPLGCGGPCPPPGFVVGYVAEIALGGGTGPNGGLAILADGTQDFVTASFLPPGMTFSSGPPGQCNQGDYVLEDLHSGNVFGGGPASPGETMVPTASGNSPYGGFAIAGGAANGDATDEVQDQPCEFQHMVVEGNSSTDPVVNPTVGTTGLGTASLRFPISNGVGGTNNYGVKLLSAGHIGEFSFVFGSAVPQLPYPGIFQFFGIDFLVNLADPLVNTTSTFWNGTVALLNNGGPPFDDGVTSMVQLPLPATVIGFQFEFNMQGYTLNFSTFAFDASGTFHSQFL